jgi:hypothetical protein
MRELLAEPSPYGGLLRRSEWLRNSRPSRLSFRRRMHDRMADVGAWLRKVVLGYYQYHAVPGNMIQLRIFKLRVCRLWQSVLVRRSQPRKDALGTFYPSPEPVDSSTPCSASLSRRTLLRYSSFVRAVCVDALVRIWAGGDQRWSSLPRQLKLQGERNFSPA